MAGHRPEIFIEGKRRCSKCLEYKIFEHFRLRPNRPGQYLSKCNDCLREYNKNLARQPKNVARYFKNHLKRRYNLTHEELEAIKILQSNKCGICETSFDVTDPHVDHNHTSGTVRGLLCGSCNRGIGLLKDSPNILLAAAKYLQSNLN